MRTSWQSLRRSPLIFLAAFAISLALAACSDDEPKEDTAVDKPVNELYNKAMDQLAQRHYKESAKAFEEVEREHPYSIWATKAELMAAYSLYQENSYQDAINALNRFIQLHPGNRDIAYAYYLRALCYYEQIVDISREQKGTRQAMAALQEVVNRFPGTAYARDARLKIDL